MKVSCIIPAYNEESRIRNVIQTVKKVKTVEEIIVVDDGSTDKTFENAKIENVTVLRHDTNMGKGSAIKSGCKNASGDTLLFLDADIKKIDVEKIESMITSITSGKYDAAIGYFKSPYYQTFTEVIYKPLVTLFFPEIMSTIKQGHLSGQRIFKRNILEKLSLSDGFDVEFSINLSLAFLPGPPRIDFIDLGEFEVAPKGYQKAMDVIAFSIMESAKKLNRLGKLKDSSFLPISKLLHETVEKWSILE